MSRSGIARLAGVLVLLLLLSGCGRLFNKEYVSITRHEEPTEMDAAEEPTFEVHTYIGLKNAVQSLIAAAAETGTIRAVDYSGSVQDDVSKVCLDVTRDFPMGAYAVEYISQTVNRILSYYEIKLRISYHLTAEEIQSVRSVTTLGDVYNMMETCAANGTEHLAVQISSLSVTERALTGYVEAYYRKHPELIASMPSVRITFYPAEDTVTKIVDFGFSYRETRDSAQEKLEAVNRTAEALTAECRDLEEWEKALLLCTSVTKSILNNVGGDTAYDALVLGAAGSEGCAMAYQLLCNLCSLDCQVVEGRLAGARRYWNIVRIDRSYYHVDTFACIGNPLAEGFLLSDDDIRLRYWWDVSKYPTCDGELSAQYALEAWLQKTNAQAQAGNPTGE